MIGLVNPKTEIDISVSKLLDFKTFAKSLRVSVSVSEIWFQKKVSVLVSKKFGLGKKSRFRFRKIGSRKKSIGFGFGKIWSRKKVSVSENLVSEKSLGFGFGKFGIVKKVSVLVSVKILVSSFSALQWLESLSSIFGLTIVCI